MKDWTVYQRNSERIRRVEEECRKGYDRGIPGPILFNYHTTCMSYECPVYVFERHNFSFCFMHKAASTTFQSHFVHLSGFRNLSKSRIQYHGHRLARYSVRALMTPSYAEHYKVLFVRHPFSRLVSSYYAKLVVECNSLERKTPGPLCDIANMIRRNYRLVEKDGPVTFKEFVSFLIDTRDKPYDSHWSRIWNVCQPCNVHYDFIGKVETYENDAHYVMKIRGLLKAIGNLSVTLNRSHSERIVGECFSQLNQTDFNELYDIYRRDFELFDYSKAPFILYIR